MLCRLMRRPLLLLALPAVAAGAVACGSEEIQASRTSADYSAAQTFHDRCGACHTLKAAGTQGSAEIANKREYKDGPNFDQRKEKYNQILYAIRNGGFSSGPMPQDIVVGADAQLLAKFLTSVSGKDVKIAPGATKPPDCPPAG